MRIELITDTGTVLARSDVGNNYKDTSDLFLCTWQDYARNPDIAWQFMEIYLRVSKKD